ncbi:TolB family protein [Brevibacillus laterosporus]|uniref:TolB family protein n=1 Tax=Brevibacillus laterosporus TaxID=1465 RepID=UPI0035A629E4
MTGWHYSTPRQGCFHYGYVYIHRIASKRPHDYDLFSIDVQGKNKRQITHTKEYQMSDLSISSDGQKLFFTKFTNTSDNRDFSQDKLSLFATDLQGKTLASYLSVNEVLGTPEMYDVHISPDNNQIATLHKHTDSPVYFHKQI